MSCIEYPMLSIDKGHISRLAVHLTRTTTQAPRAIELGSPLHLTFGRILRVLTDCGL